MLRDSDEMPDCDHVGFIVTRWGSTVEPLALFHIRRMASGLTCTSPATGLMAEIGQVQ
ncbi:hypothetical protein [Paracoccus onubensis]|uniref:hypothetical protein n=1 Tax=Paracoccus onubensis TaxID=1675788 RepID=UPI0016043CBE|nr:hypothetical protein [Paracoccus onubensis]